LQLAKKEIKIKGRIEVDIIKKGRINTINGVGADGNIKAEIIVAIAMNIEVTGSQGMNGITTEKDILTDIAMGITLMTAMGL